MSMNPPRGPRKSGRRPAGPPKKRAGKTPRPNLTPELPFPTRENIGGLLRPHYERTSDLHPIIVAKLRGNKVGRLIYSIETKQGKYRYWKMDLKVEPNYLNMGVGKYLIGQLIQHAHEHNQRFPESKITALVADIDATDKVSIALAKKMHFVQTGINYHGDRTKDNATLIFQYHV